MNDAPIERAPERNGHEALWGWFGLSRSSWLTLPRQMMHHMPDDWQAKMAALLEEWDRSWSGENAKVFGRTIVLREGARGRYAAWPDWVIDYRHPGNYGALIAKARTEERSIVLPVGDPRRAAWLQHYRNIGQADVAQVAERGKLPIDVEREWPPESPEVEEYGGVFRIPPRTPEWASHVAAERRNGKGGARRAMLMETSPGTLQVRVRWGPINREGA